MRTGKVKIWQELVSIPTYEPGAPEKNPMFLEKRVYQGSSGVVYPYPVTERVSDEKTDREWTAVFLENDFVKIMVLPELGGRVQMAYDKTRERHFIYYNQVIKPALVGLTGPWISGGIEFNWPQHHRPTTYEAVDFSMEENADGSATVWCSELERMFRTKGMAGFTLYPDKSFLEIKVKLYNKTPLPQTFLWWANPAVKVNDHYQSVFPPDVNAVFDHGKRDVSAFPIAKGTYYKVDYSPGTDISRYKNIPVPTSYMAITSKYDFVGGFEHDTQSGLLHVANHHVSPGKKQWTWGNGDFGQAWDRNLTDEDGPYIELMCGVFTDNQPDFSWLAPNEEKSFVQYFMAYHDLGLVKNATKDAMLNVEADGVGVVVKVYATGLYPELSVQAFVGKECIFRDSYDAEPAQSYKGNFALPDGVVLDDIYVSVCTREGQELVGWKPETSVNSEIPEAAKAAKAPGEIKSIEQLFLTGQHLEQYRHATFSATDYYQEALEREPGDVRCNNAMGLWLLRKGQFSASESYFKRAVKTLTERNPNPYDGEAYYNLGLSLKYQGKAEEAYGSFYKAVWNAAWQNAGYYHIAQLDVVKGDYRTALQHINQSLSRNSNDHKALHLKIAILRHLGSADEAIQIAEQALELDAFNFGARYECYLISEDEESLKAFHTLIRGNIHNYLEYALDYTGAGLWQEAVQLLMLGMEASSSDYPMASYYLGWFFEQKGERTKALEAFQKGAAAPADYCFPNQLEAVMALKRVLEISPEDAKAGYYLGNFWYAARQYAEAAQCWKKSAELDDTFPTVFRNLALSYFNKEKDPEKALRCMKRAFDLNPEDSRVLMELDQLYKRLNHGVETRLRLLDTHASLVEQRDDLYLEQITLLNHLGRYNEALELLMQRKFHPWEGGEGKVIGQYVLSLTELAKIALQSEAYAQSLDYLNRALDYPHNLGEGKLEGARENDIYYWMGCVLQKMDRQDEAEVCWKEAATGSGEPAAAIFYNDQQPDKILYQGLAMAKLGKEDEAHSYFIKLAEYGTAHLNDVVKIDYFAVSLPDLLIWEDDLSRRNQIDCIYINALGLFGLGREAEAREMLTKVLDMDEGHSGARSI
ncbi:tetratricopeptide repeat protein [Geofilum rubicundum]|nr:DUF5107 domain-containing protein [Geofilum rubicundum]